MFHSHLCLATLENFGRRSRSLNQLSFGHSQHVPHCSSSPACTSAPNSLISCPAHSSLYIFPTFIVLIQSLCFTWLPAYVPLDITALFWQTALFTWANTKIAPIHHNLGLFFFLPFSLVMISPSPSDFWDLEKHWHPQRSKGGRIQAVIWLDRLWTSQQLFHHELQKSDSIRTFYTVMTYWGASIEPIVIIDASSNTCASQTMTCSNVCNLPHCHSSPKWNSVIVNVIRHTCAFPSMTGQNICWSHRLTPTFHK